jgi:hypothetical protein
MSTGPISRLSYAQRAPLTIAVTFALFGASVPFATAQANNGTTVSNDATLTLPDAPGAMIAGPSAATPDDTTAADAAFDLSTKAPPGTASRYQKYISPGEIAPKQTTGDKFLLGVTTAVSPFSMLGWLVSAGYSQLTDISPNYNGSTGRTFFQRLGAAAALNSSREIFGDSILCPVFHQDPRYHIMGKDKGFFKRLVYSGTRPIIGRTDGGRTIPNFAGLGGTYAAAALSQAYYPPVNRGATQVAETFGESLGSSALGYVVSEFGGDVISLLQLKRSK